jgi:hypothetical protein
MFLPTHRSFDSLLEYFVLLVFIYFLISYLFLQMLYREALCLEIEISCYLLNLILRSHYNK